MSGQININMEWVMDPPEKVRLMYEAVSRLLIGGRTADLLTVSEITRDAGIGKGTAYEYFSSKEELIANALAYEYSVKLRELADVVFSREHFQERIYCIMDWIRENREYNEMFRELVRDTIQNCPHASCENEGRGELPEEAENYLLTMIGILMTGGIREGAIREQQLNKQVQVLFAAMFEYAMVISFNSPLSYGHMEEAELRGFIYEGICKRLD